MVEVFPLLPDLAKILMHIVGSSGKVKCGSSGNVATFDGGLSVAFLCESYGIIF
jgi:hypothetical protein